MLHPIVPCCNLKVSLSAAVPVETFHANLIAVLLPRQALHKDPELRAHVKLAQQFLEGWLPLTVLLHAKAVRAWFKTHAPQHLPDLHAMMQVMKGRSVPACLLLRCRSFCHQVAVHNNCPAYRSCIRATLGFHLLRCNSVRRLQAEKLNSEVFLRSGLLLSDDGLSVRRLTPYLPNAGQDNPDVPHETAGDAVTAVYLPADCSKQPHQVQLLFALPFLKSALSIFIPFRRCKERDWCQQDEEVQLALFWC